MSRPEGRAMAITAREIQLSRLPQKVPCTSGG